MPTKTPVEIADRLSRKRALVVALATVVFLGVQLIVHPDTEHQARNAIAWAINAFVLLVILATGGGLMIRRQVRALMNDDITRSNRQTAVVTGYWVAMVTAMGVYVAPGGQHLSAREAVYLVVTSSIVVALLAFSYLEYRANRNV